MNKSTISIHVASILLLAGGFLSCSQSLDNLPRNNELDPGSPTYIPTGPDSLSVDFFSEEVLQLTWYDQSFTQQQYFLERRINDGSYQTIAEFPIDEPGDSMSYRDTASVFGSYTYRITGQYDGQYQLSDTSHILAKNWLKVASRNYDLGQLIALSNMRVFVHSGKHAEIYSRETMSGRAFDASFCTRKLAYSKRLHNGNVAALCTSGQLAEEGIGVFIFNAANEDWSPAGKLKRKTSAFDLNNDQLSIIPLSSGKLLITGFSAWNSGQFTLAELVDIHSKTTTTIVDPDTHRVWPHSSTPPPAGVELTDGRVFLHSGSDDNSNLIFNPDDKSWQIVASVYIEMSSIELLTDGRVLALDGRNSGFSAAVYNPDTDSWKLRRQDTYYGFAELVKVSNGNVFGIDDGGNISLYQTETDSWIRLKNEKQQSFNFQSNSVTNYNGNVIMVNNFTSNETYIYRPAPGEMHFFEENL